MKATRILIWGKTYPDLSDQHMETICTGGCTAEGKPIRLYPIPLRYLTNHLSYRAFDWIEAPMGRSTQDPRPECYNVISKDIQVVGKIYPNKGWRSRDQLIYADTTWHYECLNDLRENQKISRASIGFIKVGAIDKIWIDNRPEEEKEVHDHHLDLLKRHALLWDEAHQQQLAFQPYRIFVKWRCKRQHGPKACSGHAAQVLDWGIGVLARKAGADKAVQKVREISDVTRFDLAFFMSNTKGQPQNFSIIGFWYPKKQDVINQKAQLSLFQ